MQVTPTSYVSVIEVDTHADEPAAARRRLLRSTARSTPSCISPASTGIDREGLRHRRHRARRRSTPSSSRRPARLGVCGVVERNPADHFSTLRTYSGAASYVTGSHSFRFGGTMSEGPRRTVERYTGDLTMTFQQRRCRSRSRCARRSISARASRPTSALFAQDKWTIGRATINAGVRFDWFQGEVHDEDLPAGRWNPAAHFDGIRTCRTGRTSARASASPTTCSATAGRR